MSPETKGATQAAAAEAAVAAPRRLPFPTPRRNRTAADTPHATTAARRSNARKLAALALLAALACVAFLTVGVNFGNERLASYALQIRAPKVAAMLIAAFAIGGASIVF